jgi:hypothetical protein
MKGCTLAGEYKITRILKHRPTSVTGDKHTEKYFVQWENSWNYKKDSTDGIRGLPAIDAYWKTKGKAVNVAMLPQRLLLRRAEAQDPLWTTQRRSEQSQELVPKTR